GRGVRAAAGEPGGERDLLAQMQPGMGWLVGVRGERAHRPNDQIGLVKGELAGPLAIHSERQRVRGPRGQLVVDRDGVIDGVQFMEPVGTQRADAQMQIDLRRDADPHRAGRPATGLLLVWPPGFAHRSPIGCRWRRWTQPARAGGTVHTLIPSPSSTLSGGAPAPPPAYSAPSAAPGSAAAIAANCSTVSDSPRAPGSTPAAAIAAAARSAPPATPANAARRVFRRCANAASTTAKTRSRGTSRRGGSRRVNATRPESTFGTGQNTRGGTRPTLRAVANQASFTDGTP